MMYSAVATMVLRGTLVSTLQLLLVVVLVSSCATLRPSADLKYVPGAVMSSLSSNASLSYVSTGQSLSGSGFLLYQKPDKIRAVILSPFGSVLQEIYISGEHITIVDPGNGVAFSGIMSELPDTGNLSAWRSIHWLVDIDQPDVARNTTVIEKVNRSSMRERVVFENGLMVSKSTAAGDQVTYRNYTTLQGVALPLEISYVTAAGEQLTIKLEDPEINVSPEYDAFTPKLNTMRVYPLLNLK